MNLIKSLAAAAAALTFSVPAGAATWEEIDTLAELVKGTGTEVVTEDCPEGIQGYYQFSSVHGIDKLAVCKNNIDMNDPHAVWEVMAHESTHVMQACLNDNIIKDTHVPRVLRELQATAPHYYSILMGYPATHQRKELEAFWMELRRPDVPIQWIKDLCYEPQAS